MKNNVFTARELARASSGMQRQVSRPSPLKKRWSVKERESILDYLHGEVGHGVKACCYYEYARASEILRKARREYNPARAISDCFPPWVLNPQRFCFLQCSSFPNSPWRDLSDDEQEDFRLLFKMTSHWPIITDVRNLDAIRVFDRFKQQAKEKRLTAHWAAIVGDDEIKHVVITVDYRDGKQAKKKQFGEWLATKSNQKLFEKYYKRPKQDPQSADHYKELLKFLAAWRLYDEFSCFKAAKEWTTKNRRQDAKELKKRAFFREKAEKTTEAEKARYGRQFFGPLYRDTREWKAAIGQAKDFLAREIELNQSADTG